jgi:hypothetical protein
MPYLYCAAHGSEQEADLAARRDTYRRAGESVLVVAGTLTGGPFPCDRCHAGLGPGDAAWLVSAFPARLHDALRDYDFGYERQYFAMARTDAATVYGVAWPDDSIRNRRVPKHMPPGKKPLCALDLLPKG